MGLLFWTTFLIISLAIWIYPPKKYRYAREIIRTQKRLGLKKSEYVYGDISSQYAHAFKLEKEGDNIYITFKLHTSVECYITYDSSKKSGIIIESGPGQDFPFQVNIKWIGNIRVPIPATGIYTPMRADGVINRGDTVAILNTNQEALQAIYNERKKIEEEQERKRIETNEEEAAERQKRRQEWEVKRLEREKEEIARKLLEQQRKRELEKLVKQELIDSGRLYGESPKRPPIPRDVVDAIYQRDKGRCVYCDSTENLHIDHIIPFSKGGDSSIDNLQILCQKCNLEKSNRIG